MTQNGLVSPPAGKRQGPTAFPEALHRGLASVAEAGGPAGWLAQRLLTGVDLLEDEVTTRQQMTGGIDAMWVSLESNSSFNPVCAATFTFKGVMTLEKLETVSPSASRLRLTELKQSPGLRRAM